MEKIPFRKPKWLPMTPSKVYRIPEHPSVPQEEVDVLHSLLDEYFRKTESLKKLFQEEIKQNQNFDQNIIELDSEEKEFRFLLEENTRENERIKQFREKKILKEFEDKQWEILQLGEEYKKKIEKSKLRVEEIVRIEKVKSTSYITKVNLDESIVLAMDNPANIGFSLSLNGTVKWDEKPSVDYEANIQRRISKAVPPT